MPLIRVHWLVEFFWISKKHKIYLQGQYLEPLFFLLVLNDIHETITNGTLRHFADDTNLLNINKFVKKINREVNYNLRLMNDWLEANKLCLSPSKASQFQIKWPKISHKNNVKYLGITISGFELTF